jgi:N-formylglutamate amidohydrolase
VKIIQPEIRVFSIIFMKHQVSKDNLPCTLFTAVCILGVLLAVGCATRRPGPAPQVKAAPEAPMVVLQEGTLPIIISAPHGGARAIPGSAPRKGKGMAKGSSGFFTGRDPGTEELARLLAAELTRITGKKPYLVVATFHRKYLDCNRPVEIACEDDAAKVVYETYHGALAQYRAALMKRFGGGLVVDLHGQGSSRQKVFRGTKNGVTTAPMRERFGEGIQTGPDSFLSRLKARGWIVHPEGDGKEQKGFTGGYITRTCGIGGTDAIQLEFGASYRVGEQNQRATAAAMASVLAEMAQYYTGELKFQPATPIGR